MRRALCIYALAMFGCGGELFDEDIGTDDQELIAQNGISLNGISLNGISLNGISLNGVSLNGTSLTGIKSGVAISGAGFVGAELTGTLSNGGTMKLKINDAAKLPAPNDDVWAYGLTYQTATSWRPLCGTTTTTKAIPIFGTFNMGQGVAGGGSFTYDATKITLGCRGTAIAKCIEIGYKPWKTVNGVLLRNHHVACTRMIRADYCGDGKAWTVDGTPINVYDGLGIQVDTSGWHNDAEWTTSGARCVGQSSPPRLNLTHGQVPSCFSSRVSSTCGSSPSNAYGHGALLIEETE